MFHFLLGGLLWLWATWVELNRKSGTIRLSNKCSADFKWKGKIYLTPFNALHFIYVFTLVRSHGHGITHDKLQLHIVSTATMSNYGAWLSSRTAVAAACCETIDFVLTVLFNVCTWLRFHCLLEWKMTLNCIWNVRFFIFAGPSPWILPSPRSPPKQPCPQWHQVNKYKYYFSVCNALILKPQSHICIHLCLL